MKNVKKKIESFVLCLICLLSIHPTTNIPAQTKPILVPHVLTVGDDKDQSNATRYSFSVDGKELIPIKIPENGSVVVQMYAENAGYINMELFTTANPGEDTLPRYWSCQCTGDIGNRGTTMRYFDKGTYYIRFPKNKYEISLVFYANRSQTIKSGQSFVAYADYNHPIYYTYKAAKNGYITIQTSSFIDTMFLPEVTLCNSKKKAITDPKSNHENTDTIVYAVKKDTTYTIKVTSKDPYGSQYYGFSLKFTSRSEKSGSSKSKAVALKLGNTASGLVFAEDKASAEDWYKVKISQKQKVTLYYSGSITSGSMLFDVFDSKGESCASYSVVANVGTQDKDSLAKKGKGKDLPKGTYYIRVKKTRKSACGIYSIQLKKGK